jgi:hypothetical protein
LIKFRSRDTIKGMANQALNQGSSLEGLLREQLVEMRAIRASLESMEKMLREVYEITEDRAISFARRTPAGLRKKKK